MGLLIIYLNACRLHKARSLRLAEVGLSPFESLRLHNSRVLMIQVQAVACLHYGTFDQCTVCGSYQALRQTQDFLIGLSMLVSKNASAVIGAIWRKTSKAPCAMTRCSF